MPSDEYNQLSAQNNEGHPEREPKHWLEYAIFAFVVATAIATGFAAWYTRQQRITASDVEKRQLRAYVFIDASLVSLEGRVLKGIVDVKNSGQTPAYHLVTKARLETHEQANRSRPNLLTMLRLAPKASSGLAVSCSPCQN